MVWKFQPCLSLTAIWLFWFKAISISEGLQCYVCHSTISWEHCEESMTTFECPSAANEVCVKDHQKANNKNRAPQFSRHCGPAKECTKKHCMAEGIECDPHCCHSDLCNTASTAKTSIGYGSIAIHSLAWIIVVKYEALHFLQATSCPLTTRKPRWSYKEPELTTDPGKSSPVSNIKR